jgi:methionine synthase II (cobalamin-independent)
MSYHADTVGSYLRPQYLLDAQEKKGKGEITKEELREIEDKAIKELVEKQVAAGLKIVTDGEYRRENYILDFCVGLLGVERQEDLNARVFNNEAAIKEASTHRDIPPIPLPHAIGKIAANPSHPEYSSFEYLKSITPAGVIPKIMIPSPNFLVVFRKDDPYPKTAYSNKEDYYKDISAAYRETILHFYQLGARVYLLIIILLLFFLYLI